MKFLFLKISFFLLCCCAPAGAFSFIDSNLVKSNPACDEAPLQVDADKAGKFDLNCFVSGKTVYVPLGELFSRLKIDFRFSREMTLVKGFYIDESKTYEIDFLKNSAVIKEKSVLFNRNDFYFSESDVCLSSELMEKLFGLVLKADLSRLNIHVSSETKLPVVAEIERNLLREINSTNRTDIKNADIFIPRKRKILGLGVMDWNVNHSHSSRIGDRYYYNLAHGSEILGGDFIANINGDDKDLFDNNNAEFRWRFVDDRKMFKQAVVGNMRLQSGLLSNTQGIQITNSPPVSRRTIGKYKIFDRTGSNWDVELYINNELIGYTKSGNDGYFEFNVPLLYGSNYITLKYYGTAGEIHTEERVIQVPFNFLPEKTVEYNITGGTLKSGNHSLFSESSVSWGINKILTSGAGMLYLNEPDVKKFYPYANTSVRILDNLIFSADYYHALKGSANLSLLLPSQIYTTFSYIRYGANEFFNPSKFSDEQNVSAFVPFYFKGLSVSFRVNGRRTVSDNYKLLFLNSGLFLNYKKLQCGIITNVSRSKVSDSYEDAGTRTSASLSYRVYGDLMIRQQTEIDHTSGRFSNTALYIDKGLFGAGWMTVYAARDYVNNNYSGGLALRFDLSFGRYNAGYSSYENGWDLQQSVYGSVGYDQFRNKFIFDNRNMVSRGGLSLVPFLDANGNDYPDDNEKILNTGFDSRINAGKILKTENECRYSDLDPYYSYRLEISPVSFDNPLYRPKYRTYGVFIDPNRFKVVPVPVYASGIVSGSVTINAGQDAKPVSGLKMLLESENGKIKTETITFSDGEYIFDNIPPGKYRIYPSPDDLSRRTLEFNSNAGSVEVRQTEDGDIIEDVNFILGRIQF
ncbi:MAG: hypothetical protein AB2L26_09795 [Ignavibacteria bacterium]